VRAAASPDHPDYVVTIQRRVNDATTWTDVGTDRSSPAYTAFDDTSGLDDGDIVHYRAVLTYAEGRTTESAERSVEIVQTPVTMAVVHYLRPAADYADWGLHLFGDALAAGEATAEWTNATPFQGTDAFGAYRVIEIGDDTKQVGFIVHRRPPGNPDIKDTDADRFFVPLECPHVFVTQGQSEFACSVTATPP
jgi:alpha-amylase